MSDAYAAGSVVLTIDGVRVRVPQGTTVAAALLLAGYPGFRTSVTGEARGPLCGMGICFECRLTIDGQPQTRSCLVTCRAGMDVRTDGE